ncbi:MAG: Crp/Fnr family transcriptional regulator [Bacteroidota bacterium]
MPESRLSVFIHQSNLVSLTTSLEIAKRFTDRRLSKNEYLLKAGQIADAYFLLDKGYMRAFAEDTAGNEVTTAFYAPGQMIFEVASFFKRTRSKENIQALTDCEGAFITYSELNELFHTLPEFREFGRSVLVDGFSTLKNRMLATITETAEERYAALLKANPEIFQHVPLKYIASYLGITDTSLSRIRAKK